MGKIRITAVTIIMLIVMAIPSVVTSAASCGETVSQDTEAILKAVDYDTNQKVADLLALSSGYTLTQITNKKIEISRRDGKNFVDITDEEALAELKQENAQSMLYGDAFAQVQERIGQIVQRIVDNTPDAETKGAAYYTDKIIQNKEKFLLGLAYIEKLYNFNMGEKNIRDVLLYEPGTYGVQTNVTDWLIKIGSAGGDTLKISNNVNVFGYGKLFWDVTGYSCMNLGAFLERNRSMWIPELSMEEWFLQAGHAYKVEKRSSWNQSENSGLYARMYNDSALRSHILPLLSVSENSVYVIANSATITYGIVDCYVDRKLKDTDPVRYREKCRQFQQELEQAAEQQKEFLDLWYRIAKTEVRDLLSSNLIVKDSLRIYADTTTSTQAEWSAKFGKDASIGVKEFFTPLGLYDSFMFLDGMADGYGVRYYLSKALSERGLSTFAHELTHIFVSSVMLNGYGARDGMEGEVYPRGMFEPYESNDPPVFNLNLIYDRLANNERLHNAVPGRFQDDTDLQEYMSGILDVIYTLDYAEAQVMFTKTPEEKKKWYHKLEQVEDTEKRSNQGDEGSKHYLDSVRELTLDEAKGLNTLDDLIRNGIIVSRYEVDGIKTTGTKESNGYYVVPLFSANYAGVQNDNGVSGDVMIRRQAFELLGEYGYYGGMVPYISNQYRDAARAEQAILSDTYILKKIFGGTYETMTDFKKAMFQKRIEKVGELKPITISWNGQSFQIRNFETLQQLMKEAVESDLINVNVTSDGYNNIRAQETQVERLKAEIFRAYLFQTKDFQEPIYGDGQEPEEPTPEPTVSPSPSPTVLPSEKPTILPTLEPTAVPTVPPTSEPSISPTPEPSITPTAAPSGLPTAAPTAIATQTPTAIPTIIPTQTPSAQPSALPTVDPAGSPTGMPTVSPTSSPLDGMDSFLPDEDGSKDGDVPNIKEIKPGRLFASVSASRTSQIIRWNPVNSADGYYIYGSRSNAKFKLLRKVGKKTCSWKHKRLKKGTHYKYYLAAYKIIGGKRVIVYKSLSIYSVTKGGKYSNPVKVRVKKSSVSMKTKKTFRLKAKVIGKKMIKASRGVRYISASPSIARVSKKGVITGVKRGSCYIYCIARNGLTKRVRVKVK